MSAEKNLLYGLIGHPVSHSFSPEFFSSKFKAEGIAASYQAFDLPDINNFTSLLPRYPNLKGLNVTIPYKESILPFLDQLSPDAEKIGAVNCISFSAGKLTGHNTDWKGFLNSLLPLLQPQQERALVLGSGGASKAVQYALQKAGIPFRIISRKAGSRVLGYAALDQELLQSHRLIINTTPLGMYPDVKAAPPIPYHLLSAGHLLYDLIYTPPETLFLQKGKAMGASIKNGQEMLELQALESWKIWQS